MKTVLLTLKTKYVLYKIVLKNIRHSYITFILKINNAGGETEKALEAITTPHHNASPPPP